MADKKFYDMNAEERVSDLRDRVAKFSMLELPGQPRFAHMGTSYLVADLWYELQRMKGESTWIDTGHKATTK